MDYTTILAGILAREGGYVNDPADNGGETNYGITAAVWRSNGYQGDIKDATVAQAKSIYYQSYIVRPGFDRVCNIHPAIGEKLIDIGVNMGTAKAAMFLQRALGVMSLYSVVVVDGVIGQRTLDTLKAFLDLRGQEGAVNLLKVINGLQVVRYVEIVESNRTQSKFFYGWINARIQ